MIIKKNLKIWLVILVFLLVAYLVLFLLPTTKQKINTGRADTLEVGSTISFNLPLYIVKLRFPVTNIDNNTQIMYGLSCNKDRTQSDNEVFARDTKLTITKIGHVQECFPHGDGCQTDKIFIAESLTGKTLQVSFHDIAYNFGNCSD